MTFTIAAIVISLASVAVNVYTFRVMRETRRLIRERPSVTAAFFSRPVTPQEVDRHVANPFRNVDGPR